VTVTAFVFIHGGGVASGFWDRLLPHVHHPTLAADLPGRAGKPFDPMTFTVDEGVQSVVADVEAAGFTADGTSVVLVAHSSGGLFAPGVAAKLPNVAHVVLSAASVPPEGGVGLEAMQPRHRERVESAMQAARRDGWVLRTPPPPEREQARTMYGGPPLDDELVDFVVDERRWVQDSMNFYYQPVHWEPVAHIPVTYVKHLQDRAVPVPLQDEMAARLPNAVRVVELDTGHVPAITDPERFAALLDEITNGLR
jgi:pimeloyl-ACP methyl ester carboxylesterase